jgi:Flp pilus assembly pilin Flp
MRRRTSRTHRRGAVLVEYALLLTFFAIPVMLGITAAGAKMLQNYTETRSHILRPLP